MIQPGTKQDTTETKFQRDAQSSFVYLQRKWARASSMSLSFPSSLFWEIKTYGKVEKQSHNTLHLDWPNCAVFCLYFALALAAPFHAYFLPSSENKAFFYITISRSSHPRTLALLHHYYLIYKPYSHVLKHPLQDLFGVQGIGVRRRRVHKSHIAFSCNGLLISSSLKEFLNFFPSLMTLTFF